MLLHIYKADYTGKKKQNNRNMKFCSYLSVLSSTAMQQGPSARYFETALINILEIGSPFIAFTKVMEFSSMVA